MSSDEGSNTIEVPERVFAFGEEPVGIRVTPYHKPCAIRRIFNALEADEVEFIRRTQFGKFVDIAELPSFSGRFGRHIISRQLKVTNRHQAWFLFAGNPVRFSLREYSLVTGLNCNKYLPHSKKRTARNINEKPYWGELFGSLKDVTVKEVIQTRIKYACLALLASVILPTTHSPRISHDHTEKIKDLGEFLAFPWVRVGFEMLMSSIKERNVISLSQNTIALKGFVLSLQLVMIEAVPALTEVVRDGSSSGSKGDFGVDEEIDDEERRGKKTISPAHARDTDTEAKAQVVPIIRSDNVSIGNESELDWSDEEEDTKVGNLMKLIKIQHPFTNDLFKGGVTKVDVIRMREEANVEAVVRKTKKQKTTPHVSPETVDFDYIAAVFRAAVKEDINRLQREIMSLRESLTVFQSTLMATVLDTCETIKFEIASLKKQCIPPTLPIGGGSTGAPVEPQAQSAKTTTTTNAERERSVVDAEVTIMSALHFAAEVTNQNASPEKVNEIADTDPKSMAPSDNVDQVSGHVFDAPNDETEDSGLICENPTFSLGLSQEDRHHDVMMPSDAVLGTGDIDTEADHIVNEFDMEVSQIVDRNCLLSAKVVDVLMHHTRSVYKSQASASQAVFLDTKFVAQLSRYSFAFPASMCETVFPKTSTTLAEHYYFPFNLDKTHWVGICADTASWSIIVLDCNITLRSDALMTREVKKIAAMFPYLIRQAGKVGSSKDTKSMTVERPRSVPQNTAQYDSALTVVLLIQAHAVAGVEVCKCITPDVLDGEAERMVVKMYEDNFGPL
ncbi:hypothetical protein N665_0077s0024 [Sinapis alba]|nr:hypothetical protein N665_0077s0024 [Sinapis alba]